MALASANLSRNLGEDEKKEPNKTRVTGQSTTSIENAAYGNAVETSTGTPIATGTDLMSLWNQAYPEASTAPTNTLARSQSDVDNMTTRDRLWDSMNYTYGQQRQASDAAYDQAFSQMGNQMLGRGMQRSSYGAQAQSNLLNKKVEAQNNIYSSQIADYEKQLLQVEQQEEAQRQFDVQTGLTYLTNILKKKGTPSDELLAQIGLSRADYNAMIKSLGGGGGGSSSGSKSGSKGGSTVYNAVGDGTGGNTGGGNTTLDFTNIANALGKATGAVTGTVGGFLNTASNALSNLNPWKK